MNSTDLIAMRKAESAASLPVSAGYVAMLISLRGGSATGAGFIAQSTANGLGQTSGTIVGGALFVWQMHAPFAIASALLLAIGGLVIWWERRATARA